MSSELLLFFDTETGGLDPRTTSLLSTAFVIYDYSADKILHKLELSVRQDPYSVTAGALNVNKIDLVRHYAVATLPAQCVVSIKDFLYPYFKDTRAQLVAHNAPFDVGFLQQLFDDAGELGLYNSLFSNNVIDTITISKFLQHSGKLKADRNSLEHLCRVLAIPPGNHTAIGDALATIGLYRKLLELVANA